MHITTWSAALAQSIAAGFATDCPIPIRLWAVLDGTIAGRILVDSTEEPTRALVQEMTEHTTYIGGRWARDPLVDAISLLRATHPVVVCCWPDDDVRRLLPRDPSYEGRAIDFTDRDPNVALDRLGVVPAPYQSRRIAAASSTLDGFGYYASMYGSVARAVEQTIGYQLLHGETVVCEAVAGPLTRGIAEIGIGTHQAYQRQGLATMTAAHVIRASEQQGYQAFWNAAETNAPSVALARRLGFRTERVFDVFGWDATT